MFYWACWFDESVSFVATSTNETLAFSSTTNFDVGLDNVQVSGVPAPLLALACPASSQHSEDYSLGDVEEWPLRRSIPDA